MLFTDSLNSCFQYNRRKPGRNCRTHVHWHACTVLFIQFTHMWCELPLCSCVIMNCCHITEASALQAESKNFDERYSQLSRLRLYFKPCWASHRLGLYKKINNLDLTGTQNLSQMNFLSIIAVHENDLPIETCQSGFSISDHIDDKIAISITLDCHYTLSHICIAWDNRRAFGHIVFVFPLN